MELTGKVVKIMSEVSGESRNGSWRKQDFVVETMDQFPKKVCCTVWGDKVEDLNNYKEGDELRLSINLESREYNERWYTDVKVWKMEALNTVPPAAYNAPSEAGGDYPPMSEDDLPF